MLGAGEPGQMSTVDPESVNQRQRLGVLGTGPVATGTARPVLQVTSYISSFLMGRSSGVAIKNLTKFMVRHLCLRSDSGLPCLLGVLARPSLPALSARYRDTADVPFVVASD